MILIPKTLPTKELVDPPNRRTAAVDKSREVDREDLEKWVTSESTKIAPRTPLRPFFIENVKPIRCQVLYEIFVPVVICPSVSKLAAPEVWSINNLTEICAPFGKILEEENPCWGYIWLVQSKNCGF